MNLFRNSGSLMGTSLTPYPASIHVILEGQPEAELYGAIGPSKVNAIFLSIK